MTTSRETIRDWLVTQLDTALVGDGLPGKTVIGSKVDDLVGMTPLVSVLSAGSGRSRMTFSGVGSQLKYEIQVWVSQAKTGWTNAQAEDALDTIEQIIAETYESAADYTVEYDDESSVFEAVVSGQPYYFERIPTRVTLNKS